MPTEIPKFSLEKLFIGGKKNISDKGITFALPSIDLRYVFGSMHGRYSLIEAFYSQPGVNYPFHCFNSFICSKDCAEQVYDKI
jgi:hypothetical protein